MLDLWCKGALAGRRNFRSVWRKLTRGQLRTIVYVDGFNLFHGVLENTPYRWLDLKRLPELLLHSDNKIIAVKYFTAHVKGLPGHSNQISHQKIYLKALEAYIPEIEIHYGKFVTRFKDYPSVLSQIHANNPPITTALTKRFSIEQHLAGTPCGIPYDITQTPHASYTQEKSSDVNLATTLLNDAWHDRFDVAVIVSNDSDFVGAISMIRNDMKKAIGIIAPVRKPKKIAYEILNFKPDFMFVLRSSALRRAQLPNPVPGVDIFKPPGW